MITTYIILEETHLSYGLIILILLIALLPHWA